MKSIARPSRKARQESHSLQGSPPTAEGQFPPLAITRPRPVCPRSSWASRGARSPIRTGPGTLSVPDQPLLPRLHPPRLLRLRVVVAQQVQHPVHQQPLDLRLHGSLPLAPRGVPFPLLPRGVPFRLTLSLSKGLPFGYVSCPLPRLPRGLRVSDYHLAQRRQALPR